MKTPTSSQYPVLDNRPIDQWKVTELKEELKRRKLTTRGLKDDLVRRLDDALRREMKEEDGNGVAEPQPGDNVVSQVPVAQNAVAQDRVFGNVVIEDSVPVSEQIVMEQDGPGGFAPGNFVENVGYADVGSKISESAQQELGFVRDPAATDVAPQQESSLVSDPVATVVAPHQESGLVSDPTATDVALQQEPGLVSDPAAPDVAPVDENVRVGESLATEFAVSGLVPTDVPHVVTGDKVSEGLSTEIAVGTEGLQYGIMQGDNEESGVQPHSEDVKPPHDEDVKKHDSFDPNNQVSEVSTSLGFPVKSTTNNNSISADSVSIIEKNDLKDNIIPDNVKLESDVKPEMVQPSSSAFVPDAGKSHPRDVDEPHHDNKVSVEETDNILANADLSHKNYSADLGSSEKLNLDRSSGDDSMEEDASESKQIDSNYNSEEGGEKLEKSEVTPLKEESPVADMDTDLPVEKQGIHAENNDVVPTSFDKRRLSDHVVLNNEPSKRQRRWKSESNNVVELQNSNVPPPAVAKDVPQTAALKRNLSISDSVGANDTPKEREVPPSSKTPTSSLRIDRFLRPFTLKAVQELLGKTGSVTSFWMDHIKTHCYVTYSSVEEAVETRNAVYNLQWPPNGGRQLLAEFVDPEEVKLRLEPPPQPSAAPVNSAPVKAPEPPTLPQPSPRQISLRQQMAKQPALPPPPPLTNQTPAREWALPPPPPPPEKVDAPIVTLDDLFRKTKATPRIYYLPLSDEQVSATLEARRKSLEL